MISLLYSIWQCNYYRHRHAWDFYFFLIGNLSAVEWEHLCINPLSPPGEVTQFSRRTHSFHMPGPTGEHAKSRTFKKNLLSSVQRKGSWCSAGSKEPKLFAGIFWWARRRDARVRVSQLQHGSHHLKADKSGFLSLVNKEMWGGVEGIQILLEEESLSQLWGLEWMSTMQGSTGKTHSRQNSCPFAQIVLPVQHH